jgi:hypothetical protein
MYWQVQVFCYLIEQSIIAIHLCCLPLKMCSLHGSIQCRQALQGYVFKIVHGAPIGTLYVGLSMP